MAKKTKQLLKKSFLKMIENSIDSNTYKNFYVDIEGKKLDVLENGVKSCALYVSGILSILGLIDKGHTTVDTTIKKLIESDWFEVNINSPEPGDVLVWEEMEFEDERNKHIGFYLKNDTAISNNRKSGVPKKHNWKYNNKRNIVKILRYKFD